MTLAQRFLHQFSVATLNSFLRDRNAGCVGGTTSVFDVKKRAMYFSKEVVPFTSEIFHAAADTPVFHHVGSSFDD